MLSAMTIRIPACISAYGDASRDEPLPRRVPATLATNPPARTEPRTSGNSSPALRPR